MWCHFDAKTPMYIFSFSARRLLNSDNIALKEIFGNNTFCFVMQTYMLPDIHQLHFAHYRKANYLNVIYDSRKKMKLLLFETNIHIRSDVLSSSELAGVMMYAPDEFIAHQEGLNLLRSKWIQSKIDLFYQTFGNAVIRKTGSNIGARLGFNVIVNTTSEHHSKVMGSLITDKKAELKLNTKWDNLNSGVKKTWANLIIREVIPKPSKKYFDFLQPTDPFQVFLQSSIARKQPTAYRMPGNSHEFWSLSLNLTFPKNLVKLTQHGNDDLFDSMNNTSIFHSDRHFVEGKSSRSSPNYLLEITFPEKKCQFLHNCTLGHIHYQSFCQSSSTGQAGLVKHCTRESFISLMGSDHPLYITTMKKQYRKFQNLNHQPTHRQQQKCLSI